MQLTSFTDYALRSLLFLSANKDRLCSVREIAEHFNISRNHLVKVMHRLSILGHIETTKGRGGGMRLAHNVEDMRLGDLIVELEPNMDLVECFNCDTNSCRIANQCSLKGFLKEAGRAFVETLNKHKLKDAVLADKSLKLPARDYIQA